MPTQVSTLSKGYSYPYNPWFMFQTIVIFRANMEVQAIMNVCSLTRTVYQDDILLQET